MHWNIQNHKGSFGEKMTELFIEKNKLASFETWKQRIEEIRSNLKSDIATVDEVNTLLQKAIESRVTKDCEILLSGGIDSSLIAFFASKHFPKIPCITVGFQDGDMNIPPDVESAKKVAEKFKLNHIVKVCTEEEAESLLPQVLKILKLKKPLEAQDIVNCGVGLVVAATVPVSPSTTVLGGLGSEEIFAGYERHAKAKNIQEECWNGLINMWNKDLNRDSLLAEKYHLTLKTPFLDKDLIEAAMRLPDELKIEGDQKKIVLRKIAELHKFPEEFAWRKKKAAQYGSGSHKMLQRLAKKNGFEFVKDYVESLL